MERTEDRDRNCQSLTTVTFFEEAEGRLISTPGPDQR